MGERTIILHYHLFKNAGTSVDAILKRNFGAKWVTQEFPGAGGNNTSMVEKWIEETPEAVAYSSHTMLGPIPRVSGVRVISFILLRDPIERIKSAYRFERTQAIDSWETQLAKDRNFEGYVRARLARPGDRQCRNFQTHRLASFLPGPDPELERAKKALKQVTVVGRVESFKEAVERLATIASPTFPEFEVSFTVENSSSEKETVEVSKGFLDEVRYSNADDINLVNFMNKDHTT